jgi:uncharacterized membrane protein YtjA (UPF0391 family)
LQGGFPFAILFIYCGRSRLRHTDAGRDGHEGAIMLYWAILFLIVAIIAGLFGFTTIAGTAVGIAKVLFFLFLILFVIFLFIGRK